MFLSTKRDPKNLKSSKKNCKEQQTKFWEKRNDELKGSKGEKFWNSWKSCGEISETKAQIFVMDQKENLSIQNYSKIPIQTIISIPQTYQSKRKHQKKFIFSE